MSRPVFLVAPVIAILWGSNAHAYTVNVEVIISEDGTSRTTLSASVGGYPTPPWVRNLRATGVGSDEAAAKAAASQKLAEVSEPEKAVCRQNGGTASEAKVRHACTPTSFNVRCDATVQVRCN